MIFETDRFEIVTGTAGEDPDVQYLVKNKATGVVEFCNSSLYFVRDWAMQFTGALEKQDEEIKNPQPDVVMDVQSDRPN